MIDPRMGNFPRLLAPIFAALLATSSLIAGASTDADQWRGYTQLLKQTTDSGLASSWREKRAYPYLQKAYALIAENRTEAAGEEFAKYFASNRKHAYFNWAYLQFLANVSDHARAVEVASALIEAAPAFAPAYYLRGLSHKALKQQDAAIRDLEKAISLKSLSAGHRDYAQRELVYLQADTPQEARALQGIQRLELTTGLDDDLLLKKATLLQKSGQAADAASAWRQLAEQAKDVELRRHAIRSLYFLAADLTDKAQAETLARETFTRFRAEHQACDMALVGANTFAKLGHHSQALAALQVTDPQAEDCKSRQTLLLRTGATYALAARDRALAKRYVDQLAKTDAPAAERGDLLEQLGDLHYQSRDYKQALASYQAAARLKSASALSLKVAEAAWQVRDYAAVGNQLDSRAKDAAQPDATADQQCVNHQREQKFAEALACLEQLAAKHPGNVDYLKRAAFVADRANDPSAKLKYLSMIYQREPDSRTALDIGYLLRQRHERAAAAKWFKEAGKSPGNSRANLEYLFELFASGRSEEAAAHLKAVRAQLDPEDQLTALTLLGHAEYNAKRYPQAVEAFGRAYEISKDQRLLLNMLRALNAAGQYDNALRLVKSVKLETLNRDERIEWYKEAALAMFNTKQIHNSVYLRSKLVEWEPNRDNWYSYAIALSAANQPKAAVQALNEALRLGGETPEALETKTYLASAAGADAEAIAAADKVLASNPNNARLQEDTGYLKLRNGDREGAARHFKQVIEQKYGQNASASDVPHYVNLSDQVRAIEQPLTVRLSDTGCFNESGCRADRGLTSDRSGMGFGSVELNYQLSGPVAVDGFGRVFWNNDNDSFTPDGDSTVGALGLGVRPLAEHNLRLSLEKQFKVGDAARDNLLGRVAWSSTRNASTRGRQGGERWDAALYQHLYVEFAKLLQNEKDSLFYAEGRLGKAYRLTASTDVLPYGFARARRIDNTDERTSVELGVGVALNSDHLPHPHYGHRARSNLFVEYGHDVLADPMDEDYRVLTGIHFSYQ